jgi:hypothetical protein
MIRSRTKARFLLLVCLSPGLVSCVDVNGGAVELRWEIRNSDGAKWDCGEAQVARVRLHAEAIAGGKSLDRSWACHEYQAATAFELTPGRYALSIEPVCGGEDAGPTTAMARVPEPILRDISNGNVAELNTLLIEKLPRTGAICPNPP